MRRCRSDISSVKVWYFSLMRKTLDSVLRQLPWKQNWCLILVIRLSFRKGGEDISYICLLIMKDFAYRELPVISNFTDLKEGKQNKNWQNWFYHGNTDHYVVWLGFSASSFKVYLMWVTFSKSMTMVYQKPACSLAGQVLKWFLMLLNHFLFNILHRSFVTTYPTYGVGWGIAGLMCGAITFRSSPQCWGKCQGYNFAPK